jgi:hypothetical protein
MNNHYRSLTRAGIHAPNHLVLWSTEFRGHSSVYVVYQDRFTPLAEWLQAHGQSAAEAGLVNRSQLAAMQSLAAGAGRG